MSKNTVTFEDRASNILAHTSGFELFTQIVDDGVLNWDKGFKRAIIDKIDTKTNNYQYLEGYYPILLEQFGRRAKFTYTIADDYGAICKCRVQFLSSKNYKIAQVVNYPTRINTAMGAQLVDPIEKQVSVGTYCDNGRNEVVVINRFDAIGLPHCNNYDFYGPLARTLYQKYFSDTPDPTKPEYVGKSIDSNGRVEFPKRGGGTEFRYISETPHFHFQSVEQTQNFRNGQATSNAISITKLLEYLEDLEQGNEPLLYNESLGMPFLNYYNNERSYNSKMYNFLQNAHKVLAASVESEEDVPESSKEIVDFMESLINIYDDGQTLTITDVPPNNTPTDPFDPKSDDFEPYPDKIDDIQDPGDKNIALIKRDLVVAQSIINMCPEEYSLVAALSQTLVSSINSIGFEKDQPKELEYER